MQNYIYILPFLDGKHFKIGISSNDLSRVKEHNRIYGVDKKKALVFEGNKRIVRALESSLLSICPQVNGFNGKDGHTEIREIKHLEECMGFVKFYENQNKISQKSIDLTPVVKETIKKKQSKRTVKEPYCTLTKESLNNFVDAVILFISDKKIECLKKGAYYTVLFNSNIDENKRNLINKYQLFFECYLKNSEFYSGMGMRKLSYCPKTTTAEATFFINPFSSMDSFKNECNFSSLYKEPYKRLNNALEKAMENNN